jgi:arginyl-tRNA synthetase
MAAAIKERLHNAAKAAVTNIKGGAGVDLPAPDLSLPTEEDRGDFTSTYAFALARTLRRPPREIAEFLVEHLDLSELSVAGAVAAGAGFLNFQMASAFWSGVLAEILAAGEDYGRRPTNGRRVLIEFVSANPTGPLNVVNARAAAVGDTLAALLERAGYQVEREFYVNDAGRQVELLGLSLEARLRQLDGEPVPIPEGGYPGEYLVEMARRLKAEDPRLLDRTPSERRLTERAVAENLAGQRETLSRYRVAYTRWYRESTLHPDKVQETLAALSAAGSTYEQDGAVWLATTRLGDDKDRVLVRADGEPTYLAADLAYHREKFRRGYDRCLDLLGPDHHGYVARIRAGVAALGYPPAGLEVILVQQVRLLREGQAVSMSKRGGEFFTMAELLDEVGTDAARFFFLQRGSDSHLDFDLSLARLQENENPVYYVQYAHARIRSLLRRWTGGPVAAPDAALLASPEELALLRQLSLFPGEVRAAAEDREPHRLSHYVLKLAGLFHSFYNRQRVLGEEGELEKARLGLVTATGAVLRSGLSLLGVAAPDSM